MGLGKEKARLEKLLILVSSVEIYDETSFEVLNEALAEYSLVIRVLHKSHPNVFGNLFNYELPDIKQNKKFTKNSFSDKARQDNFIAYKDSIIHASERTIESLVEYLHI